MSATEEDPVDLESARRVKALDKWVVDCRAKMKSKWPAVDFNADRWPLQDHYKTKINNITFANTFAFFKGKDHSYKLAIKCLMAEIALEGEVKSANAKVVCWRLLSILEVSLHQICRSKLFSIEQVQVEKAKANCSKAPAILMSLMALVSLIRRLGEVGVIDRLAWSLSPQTKYQLLSIQKSNNIQFKTNKAGILERQIEALSDAQAAMLRGDERLSAYDRVALAVMGINMCCPNRINEPLCMEVGDHFTLEDYCTPADDRNIGDAAPVLVRVHQMLLLKGSKGAEWGGKPILNFMIAFADLCISIIKQHGERSRMLVSWYEMNPDVLYLPPCLEYLRGTYVDVVSLWKICNLVDSEPPARNEKSVKGIWQELKLNGFVQKIANPKVYRSNGTLNSKKTLEVVSWANLEKVLLARVGQAMDSLRRVTQLNSYQGRLSNMLMLFDADLVPYLPNSVRYKALANRLVRTPSHARNRIIEPAPTLFEKLNIKMVVNGVVQTAYINTHDPRRWLTTQALDSDLPDVLANKWANRLNINQLQAYDLRSPEAKAQQASMPVLKELEDITQGLQKLEVLEDDYGLKTQIFAVGDANIAITSMNDIMQATEDRPIARTANQIIILYPQRYGVCLHQHHERPCRSYKCGPCNEGVIVKGHLPTNERVRNDAVMVFNSIVNQLEALLIARHREVADCPSMLDEHILTLVSEGLNPKQMAKELIVRFHEIKDQIKDKAFAIKLGDAFALTGYVEQLGMESNRPGALIKYHNPSYHASPGHERVLDALHGGRAKVRLEMRAFEKKYPHFAQTKLSKVDQRDLLKSDADDELESDDE